MMKVDVMNLVMADGAGASVGRAGAAAGEDAAALVDLGAEEVFSEALAEALVRLGKLDAATAAEIDAEMVPQEPAEEAGAMQIVSMNAISGEGAIQGDALAGEDGEDSAEGVRKAAVRPERTAAATAAVVETEKDQDVKKDEAAPGGGRAGRDAKATVATAGVKGAEVEGSPKPAEAPVEQLKDEPARPKARAQEAPDAGRRAAADSGGTSAGQRAAVMAGALDEADSTMNRSSPEGSGTASGRADASALRADGLARPAADAGALNRVESRFVETNHPNIVRQVQTQLMPNGGTMRIRLDPPELGTLQVTLRVVDGVMTAAFQTASDAATQMLSHSLGQLKAGLESQGVNVDRLQVQQTREAQPAQDEPAQQRQEQEESARQQQQRREMLQRMWRKLALGDDPLDLVA